MNTYIIEGNINYFIKNKINEITNNNEYINFDMLFNSYDELFSELSYFDMFNQNKYIVVRNCNLFLDVRKTEEYQINYDRLVNYLNNENKCITLIFILDKSIDSRKKISKLIKDNNNYIKIDNLKKKDIFSELNIYLNNLNYKIEYNDLWYIINNSDSNFDICLNEINKLICFNDKNRNISHDSVINLVSFNIPNDIYILIDYIVRRDLTNTLKYIDMINIYKIEIIKIIINLAYTYRNILYLKYYYNKKESIINIKRYLNMGDYQYKVYTEYERLYNERELKEILVNLSDIDYKLKSVSGSDLLLYNFIIKNCEV